MATLEEHFKPTHPVVIAGDSAKQEVRIAATDTRPGYLFRIDSGRVDVFEMDGDAEVPTREWRGTLTPYEKVNVMNRLLMEYRKHSRDPDGVKVASAVVTTSGNMYIAVNGHITPRHGIRQCSEQTGVSNAATYESSVAHKRGIDAEELKIDEIYIEGGRDPDMHIMGPCGDCTDMLSKAMVENGKVWVLPASYGRQYIEINDTAEWIGEVPKNEAWATDIGFLTRNRVVELNAMQQTIQADAHDTIVQSVRAILNKHVAEDPNDAVLNIDFSRNAVGSHPIYSPEIFENKLAHYMQEQIVFTLANRMQAVANRHGLGDIRKLNDEALGMLIKSEVRWVRCAVVQRDDGKLFAAVTARIPGEKSTGIAEHNAVGQGMRKAGTERFADVWCMEFNPEKGSKLMRTSSASAVENLLKWASLKKGTVDFHYLPFSDGTLNREQAQESMVHFKAHQLYPSMHAGTPAVSVEAGEGVVHGGTLDVSHVRFNTVPPGSPGK